MFGFSSKMRLPMVPFDLIKWQVLGATNGRTFDLSCSARAFFATCFIRYRYLIWFEKKLRSSKKSARGASGDECVVILFAI